MTLDARPIKLLEGDPAAIAAIRDGTRSYYQASDIAEDANVVLWYGLLVLGSSGREYEVPEHLRQRYIERRPFPQAPFARLPQEPAPTAPADPQAELANGGVPLGGDPGAVNLIRTIARLFHEVDHKNFPADGEVRWFPKGLFVVGADGKLFGVPMSRVEDLLVPQPYPLLPIARMTEAARRHPR